MCGPLLAAVPALGSLSGALAAAPNIGLALGIGSAAANYVGSNSAISAQQRQIATQTTRAYSENAMRRWQADRNAAQEGYQASREGDMATGRAAVRNTALGISGTTANEMVGEEVRAGSYNVASALEQSRDARTAELMSNKNTYAESSERVSSLQSQRPGVVSTLLSMGTMGLSGYLAGDRVATAAGVRR